MKIKSEVEEYNKGEEKTESRKVKLKRTRRDLKGSRRKESARIKKKERERKEKYKTK